MVRHEVEADVIVMLPMTNVYRSREPCLVVDYGTNAEIALIYEDERIIAGSVAGPAIKEQSRKGYSPLPVPYSI